MPAVVGTVADQLIYDMSFCTCAPCPSSTTRAIPGRLMMLLSHFHTPGTWSMNSIGHKTSLPLFSSPCSSHSAHIIARRQLGGVRRMSEIVTHKDSKARLPAFPGFETDAEGGVDCRSNLSVDALLYATVRSGRWVCLGS